MNIEPNIAAFAVEFADLRRDLHAHPELGFEEKRTAGIVAERLRQWGIETHIGIGGTGVVGVLSSGKPGKTIGLRADMDALPMDNALDVPWKSTIAGRFHGCGHDGHTAALLMVAHHLATTGIFCGSVVFIFQPAEEGLGGARAMLKDGLFQKFPCDEIYAWHNWPQLDFGQVSIVSGKAIAGGDFFDITLTGKGAHSAQPHLGRDVIPAAGNLLGALQTAVSRNLDPVSSGVLSVTKVQAGSAYNVLPETAHLAGTIRYLEKRDGELLRATLHRIANGVAAAHGVAAEVDVRTIFTPTYNDPSLAREIAIAAADVVDPVGILTTEPPTLGSEDFADMLEQVPGVYFMVGHKGTIPLHHPEFEFDDDVLPLAASVLVSIVKNRQSAVAPQEERR